MAHILRVDTARAVLLQHHEFGVTELCSYGLYSYAIHIDMAYILKACIE